jgi:hypothetical protein
MVLYKRTEEGWKEATRKGDRVCYFSIEKTTDSRRGSDMPPT